MDTTLAPCLSDGLLRVIESKTGGVPTESLKEKQRNQVFILDRNIKHRSIINSRAKR